MYGRDVPADDVFRAWTGGEVSDMVRVLSTPTDPVDRFHLLSTLLEETYRRRKGDPVMRELAVRAGELLLVEHDALWPAVLRNAGSRFPGFYDWPDKLIKLFEEVGRFDDARSVISWLTAHPEPGDDPAWLARAHETILKSERRWARLNGA